MRCSDLISAPRGLSAPLGAGTRAGSACSWRSPARVARTCARRSASTWPARPCSSRWIRWPMASEPRSSRSPRAPRSRARGPGPPAQVADATDAQLGARELPLVWLATPAARADEFFPLGPPGTVAPRAPDGPPAATPTDPELGAVSTSDQAAVPTDDGEAPTGTVAVRGRTATAITPPCFARSAPSGQTCGTLAR